jgi:hypothetical protein
MSSEVEPATASELLEIVLCHLVTSCGCTRTVHHPQWEADLYRRVGYKVPLPNNKIRYFKYLRLGTRGPEIESTIYVFLEVP